MAARFVTVDHDTPLLLPPDLREWVPADHLVPWVMDAVGQLELGAARVNERGTGDAQYPPGKGHRGQFQNLARGTQALIPTG